MGRFYGGDRNSAFGHDAFQDGYGSFNTAIGGNALDDAEGDSNVAVGFAAGSQLITGSDNIYIANRGESQDEGQIRIGNTDDHTDAFIAGIHTNFVPFGVPVFVAADGRLGTLISSARFKRDIHDMATHSNVLMELRPVTFLYREEIAGGDDERQYGLIAEEVALVAPDLVLFDEEGKPFSVHYERLAPMLLNEMQKQHRTIARLKLEAERNEALERRTTALLACVDALETQLAGESTGAKP